MSVLLTGASGFVGKAILKTSQHCGLKIRPSYRSLLSSNGRVDAVLVHGLDSTADWTQALESVQVVIHIAARVHIMREEVLDPLSEYRRVNLQGSLNLARQSAASGVKRFLFISSIKVNCDATAFGHPFTADNNLVPEDPYVSLKGRSRSRINAIG